MRIFVSGVVGVARFLYGFVVGDDWWVALAIVIALAATGLLVGARISAWWLVPFVAIFMTGVSLQRSAHKRRPAVNP
jgi:uncharacterized membrane protein YfcA